MLKKVLNGAEDSRKIILEALSLMKEEGWPEDSVDEDDEGMVTARSHSVGPSTRWLSDDNSRTLGPRIMKLHRYIDHDSQMTPIDFEVIRIMKLHG
ncbi:hypothetical protein DPMN_004783 [Dreissena polymorpha]|uniref:Uncharacterized protein n=1 Tax=Dreissena polymorpha TaxID=45954 RepID=A0A9D4RTA1_DREPO|nr:hypothetical protein DPMN_004783 [Dreissena polymorpha]